MVLIILIVNLALLKKIHNQSEYLSVVAQKKIRHCLAI